MLHEMRAARTTPVHKSGDFAELVCSNSFRADDPLTSTIGIQHREMRQLSSLVLAPPTNIKRQAGAALAVDREGFARCATERLLARRESKSSAKDRRNSAAGLGSGDYRHRPAHGA